MLARIGIAALLTLGICNKPSHGTPKSPQTGEPGSSVRFRLRDRYQVIVPVSVNGMEPRDFILDTGTKTTMIDERIGRMLGLQAVARMPLTTFTGTVMVNIGRTDTVAMGIARARGLEVGCVDLHQAYSLDPDIYGILGSDFLSRFNFLLDYRGQRVRIEQDGDLEKEVAGSPLAVEPREYRDHIHYDSGSPQQEQIHFMLDSGTPQLVVFEKPKVSSCLQVTLENRATTVADVLGNRSVALGRLSVFRIGGEVIRNLAVRMTIAHEIERRWEDGLLPTNLFSGIYFNHGESYVILNPRLPR